MVRYVLLRSTNTPYWTIWNAVKNKQSEVVVGPAVLATETYRLFPGLVQFMMGKRL